jgi:hypothetical protein
MADPKDRPGEEAEAMPELPGSGTPPIEGRKWVQVKIAVWAVVGLALAGVAWGVASVVA